MEVEGGEGRGRTTERGREKKKLQVSRLFFSAYVNSQRENNQITDLFCMSSP